MEMGREGTGDQKSSKEGICRRMGEVKWVMQEKEREIAWRMKERERREREVCTRDWEDKERAIIEEKREDFGTMEEKLREIFMEKDYLN